MDRSHFQSLAKLPKRYVLVAALFFIVGLCTINIQGQSLMSLLASATSSVSTATVTAYFTPHGGTALRVGDVADLDISINAGTPINALDMTVVFPSDIIDVVGISKQNSFLDLWIEDTVIKEEAGEVHFSGGTTKRGGQEGVSTVLTLTVRARKPGTAEFRFNNTQILASDGKGTALRHAEQAFAYEVVTPLTNPASTQAQTTVTRPQAPSPDLNDSGTVTLVDASILALRMFAPYEPRYDLDMNGNVGLSDLSILFSAMRGE